MNNYPRDVESVRKLLLDFIPTIDLPEGYRLLDVGCGSGGMLKHVIMESIPQNYSEVVGLDFDEEFIVRCNDLFSEDNSTKNDSAESESTEGESSEGDSSKNDSAKGDSTEGESTEGDSTEDDSNESNSIKVEYTEVDSTESDSSEGDDDSSTEDNYGLAASLLLWEQYFLFDSQGDAGYDDFTNAKCRFICADFDVPFEELPNMGKFDIITSFSMFQTVENKAVILQNMSKLLNPNGAVLIKMAEYKLAYDNLVKMYESPKWKECMRDFELVSVECYDLEISKKFLEILMGEFFEIIDVKTQFQTVELPEDNFGEMFKGQALHVFVNNIEDPEEQIEYLEELLEMFEHVLKDGVYRMEYQVIILTGKVPKTRVIRDKI